MGMRVYVLWIIFLQNLEKFGGFSEMSQSEKVSRRNSCDDWALVVKPSYFAGYISLFIVLGFLFFLCLFALAFEYVNVMEMRT